MPDASSPSTSEVQKTTGAIEFRKHDNYENWYSNNINFQQSEWDLKLIFGQLDWEEDHYVVEQHTAITVAWLQAKLMIYYLSVQMGVYEKFHGKIPIPPAAMPPQPPPPTEEQAKDPAVAPMYDYMQKRWEEFMVEQSR